ncbi:MAG: MFS transporter [Lentisphaerae bacterium]|nr:MFS transporter [Lentisphaerota bacterium]
MTQPPITTVQKLRGLPWLYVFNASLSVFVLLTVFGAVFPLYLNELGLSKARMGFVLSLPPFMSLLALFVSRWVVRVGAKQVAVSGFGIRTVVIGFLLLSPWILSRFGVQAVFFWVAGIMLLFSICRSFVETAWLPWAREFVPDVMRGKVDATSNLVGGLMGGLATLGASFVLARWAGLGGYSLLIAVGVVFGLVSMAALTLVPGGAPLREERARPDFLAELLVPLRDRNYLCFLIAGCIFNLAGGILVFTPLYFKEQIGLGSDKVLMLDAVFRLAFLLSTFIWGWCVDRYGGKSVLLTGMVVQFLFPLCLFLLPRHSAVTLGMALAVWAVYGLLIYSFSAGASRYFYVTAVPQGTGNSAYFSLSYAMGGLFSAVAPILAGWLLDVFKPLQIAWGVIHLDAFSPLFALSMLLYVVAGYLYHRIRNDGPVRTKEFMSLFLQGNPILAFGSILRYHMADTEKGRISTTEQMGEAKNPLSATDLLEALSDPSFNVRYEAIVSIARMPPNASMTRALIGVLRSQDPDLSVAAGWALGRIGDPAAIPALREMLVSEYALLRSRSARSLANLGDVESVPSLRNALGREKHDGIRVAYASALGAFRVRESLDDLFALLRRLAEKPLREEVTLAVARMAGNENDFIVLWRHSRSDFGTAAAEALMALKKKLEDTPYDTKTVEAGLEECAQLMAALDVAGGASGLCRLIPRMPLVEMEPVLQRILSECVERLGEFGGARTEYVLMTLHVLQTALKAERE